MFPATPPPLPPIPATAPHLATQPKTAYVTQVLEYHLQVLNQVPDDQWLKPPKYHSNPPATKPSQSNP